MLMIIIRGLLQRARFGVAANSGADKQQVAAAYSVGAGAVARPIDGLARSRGRKERARINWPKLNKRHDSRAKVRSVGQQRAQSIDSPTAKHCHSPTRPLVASKRPPAIGLGDGESSSAIAQFAGHFEISVSLEHGGTERLELAKWPARRQLHSGAS